MGIKLAMKAIENIETSKVFNGDYVPKCWVYYLMRAVK